MWNAHSSAPSTRGNNDPNCSARRNPAEPSKNSIAPSAISQASNAGAGDIKSKTRSLVPAATAITPKIMTAVASS